MTVEARDLLQKINFIEVSRTLKERQAIDEYLPIPETIEEERAVVKELMFRYLKHRFRGCRIRTNSLSFSIRLDGEVHRKAEFIRETIWSERKWRDFFSNNHAPLARVMNNAQNSFTGEYDLQTRDTYRFIYVPFSIERIREYTGTGIKTMISRLDHQYQRDLSIFERYDEIFSIVNQEIARQEEEQREKIMAEKRAYLKSVEPLLYQSLRSGIDFSSSTVEGKLAQKMMDWCNERKIKPVIANEPTERNVIPVGTKVRVVAESNSNEENWYAVPLSDGFAIPEGYEQKPGWGKVTKIDTTSPRSRNGQASIVVEEYLYLGFDLSYWEHVLPEGYLDVLEATRRFRQEAEAECAQEQCDEGSIQDILQAEVAQEVEVAQATETRAVTPRVRATRAEPAPSERKQSLIDALRAQVTQPVVEQAPVEPVPVTPIAEDEEEDDEGTEHDVFDVQAAPVVDPATRENGIYYNAQAIPLERYILKIDGQLKRFRTLAQVNHYINAETAYIAQGAPFHVVREWANPTVIFENQN